MGKPIASSVFHMNYPMLTFRLASPPSGLCTHVWGLCVLQYVSGARDGSSPSCRHGLPRYLLQKGCWFHTEVIQRHISFYGGRQLTWKDFAPRRSLLRKSIAVVAVWTCNISSSHRGFHISRMSFCGLSVHDFDESLFKRLRISCCIKEEDPEFQVTSIYDLQDNGRRRI